MKTKALIFVAVCAAVLGISVTASAQICHEDGTIKLVTKAAAGKYETVKFEMLIKDPTLEVSNAKPPFSMYGSEKRLTIKGPYYKSIVVRGINWECQIGENFAARTANIRAVKSIEQFEGQVEYIIGYAKKGSYIGQSITKTKKGSIVVLNFRK